MKATRYIVFGLIVLIVAWLIPAIKSARESARQSSCLGKMAQLQLALRNYEHANGHFPPAYILGPDGTPWHSWRVLILPYFEAKAVYEQYRFDEPWNGPNNSKLANQMNMSWFQCPSEPDSGQTLYTNYVAVVGEATVFPGASTTNIGDIKDGPENTILLAEIGNSDIHWMEPRDLEFENMAIQTDPDKASSTCVSSHHPAGPAVVFADRIHAYRLRQPFSKVTLRALCTIAGSEEVSKASLEKRDHHNSQYLKEADD